MTHQGSTSTMIMSTEPPTGQPRSSSRTMIDKLSTPMKQPRYNSCMTVQTQHESLADSSELRDAARLRRKQRRSRSITFGSQEEVEEVSDQLSVGFTSVELRQYPIRLGDNPSVSSGPPLTIGWKPIHSVLIDLEQYESERSPRRASVDMLLSNIDRFDLLQDSGHGTLQIYQAEVEVRELKKQRDNTVKNLKFSKLEEATEGFRKKLSKIFRQKKKEEEEEEPLSEMEKFINFQKRKKGRQNGRKKDVLDERLDRVHVSRVA